MNGILLIDKPQGWTSFDVVNYVRRIVARIEGKKPRNVKVGHTGTLDPLATGLLVLCVGKATKQVSTLIKHDKTYEVELTLGFTSTTGDADGELLKKNNVQIPDALSVEQVIQSFIGEIDQVPPAYSAIKVNGKRAYELARAGKPVKLSTRRVQIYDISDLSYVYPYIRFTASVGSGTYIRSLGESIGEKLGCGAYMSALNRTRVGEYVLKSAHAVTEVTEELLQKELA